MGLLPEQLARIKIDKQLNEAGWDIVSRDEYIPNHAEAVKEALMSGSTESDYLLFIDNKAVAVVEANVKKILWAMMSCFKRKTMPIILEVGMAYGLMTLSL